MLKWNRLFIDAISLHHILLFLSFLFDCIEKKTDQCTRLRVEYFPAKEKGKNS